MPEAPITNSEQKPETASMPAKKKRSAGRMLGELLIVAPLAILALEAIFALTGAGEQNYLKPDLELGAVHIPNKVITWRLEGYSHDRFSSSGWRDVERSISKPEKIYRVALLGDSQTECMQVPRQKNWASLTEVALNQHLKSSADKKDRQAEVLNFGVSGYSTGQELLQLKKYVLQYKPDLVVLFYSRGDSMENTVSALNQDIAEPRPYFYLDQNKAIQQDNSILLANDSKLKSNPLLEFLRAHSRIYGVLDQTNFMLNLNDKLYNRLRRFFSQIGNKIAPQKQINLHNHGLQDGFVVTQALIKEISAVCKQNQAQLLVMTFPDIGNIDPVFATQLAALREQSKADGFDMLELSQPFRDYRGTQPLFLQVHFAEDGHKTAAQALSQRIEKLMNW